MSCCVLIRNAFLSIYVLISDVKSHSTYISNMYSIGIALHDRSVQGLYRLHSAPHALICNVRFSNT